MHLLLPFFDFLEYKLISKIGFGAFSEVIKAKNIKNGKDFAIKCMKEKISIDKVLCKYLSLKVLRLGN